MLDWVGPNIDIVVAVAVVLIVGTYRWFKTRQALYRMTDAINEILRAENAGEIDFIRSPKLRRLLSLTQIAKRLEEKILRLKMQLAQKASENETQPRQSAKMPAIGVKTRLPLACDAHIGK